MAQTIKSRPTQNRSQTPDRAISPMKITVIGTGHVGLVWGTCLAEVGNDAAHFGTIQFIPVGTPPDEYGSAGMKYVTAAAATSAAT